MSSQSSLRRSELAETELLAVCLIFCCSSSNTASMLFLSSESQLRKSWKFLLANSCSGNLQLKMFYFCIPDFSSNSFSCLAFFIRKKEGIVIYSECFYVGEVGVDKFVDQVQSGLKKHVHVALCDVNSDRFDDVLLDFLDFLHIVHQLLVVVLISKLLKYNVRSSTNATSWCPRSSWLLATGCWATPVCAF